MQKVKLTAREGLPTKAAIRRLVALANTSINSIDNLSNTGSISWQHHNMDRINIIIDYLRSGGFVVTDITPYKPKELRCGHFKIQKKNE